MAKGVSTPPEVVEKIKLCKAIGMTNPETAKVCSVSESAVFTIMKRIKDNPEENKKFEELKERKKEELQKNAEAEFDAEMKNMFETLLSKSAKVIDKAIDQNKLTPRDAVAVMGTVFDKRQVLTGGRTANVGITYDEVLKAINKGEEY